MDDIPAPTEPTKPPRNEAAVSPEDQREDIRRDAVKKQISSARDKLLAISPRTADIEALINKLDGLLDAANTMPVAEIGAALSNMLPQVTAEIDQANAEFRDTLMRGIMLADAYVENGYITDLDGFARQHRYDAAVLRNFASPELFGEKLGHDPAFQHMVGGIANHGTEADRQALAQSKDKISAAVHLVSITGQPGPDGKPMTLSRLAGYHEGLKALKESVLNDPTLDEAARTNAAHFIALYENKARIYKEAKAAGLDPQDRPVSTPIEFQGLIRTNFPDEASFKKEFMQRYAAYETRKTAELSNNAANLTEDKLTMMKNYAANCKPPIDADPAKNPGWLFQVKQQLDLQFSSPRELFAAYKISEKGGDLPVTTQAAIDMTVLNNMYGNQSSAAIFHDTMEKMSPSQREAFFKQTPEQRLASVSKQLNSQVSFEDRAALQLALTTINSETEYQQFNTALATSKATHNPAELTRFMQEQMYPELAGDKNAPAAVQKVNKALQFDGAKRLLLSTDPNRFSAEAIQANLKRDEASALKALTPEERAEYEAYRKTHPLGKTADAAAPEKKAETAPETAKISVFAGIDVPPLGALGVTGEAPPSATTQPPANTQTLAALGVSGGTQAAETGPATTSAGARPPQAPVVRQV